MSIVRLIETAGLYKSFSEFVLKISILVFAFFAPLKGILLTLFALVFIDLVTGLAAAIKKKNKITSAKLSKTVTKLMVYLITIILVKAVNDYVIVSSEIPLTSLVSSFIILTELQSVLENLNKMTHQTFLKILIDKLSLITKGKHIH